MSGRKFVWVLGVLLLVALPWLTASCSKKQVQMDEGLASADGSAAGRSGMGPGGRPTEESLTAAERQRREAEAAFTSEDVYFEYDKYDLSPRAREVVSNKALFLKSYPTVKVLIEGHCDERGTSEYNLALGERRANAVKQYLLSLGVDQGRVSTVSYGKERPQDPGHNEAAWSRNRRAHFVIVSR
jgi:peptidoglycan-associated lipoprotein